MHLVYQLDLSYMFYKHITRSKNKQNQFGGDFYKVANLITELNGNSPLVKLNYSLLVQAIRIYASV